MVDEDAGLDADLRWWGWDVRSVAGIPEALEQIGTFLPDLVIAAIRSDALEALGVVIVLSERLPGVPIIAIVNEEDRRTPTAALHASVRRARPLRVGA